MGRSVSLRVEARITSLPGTAAWGPPDACRRERPAHSGRLGPRPATRAHALFVGPHTLPCPPYESVYQEPSWSVMGETTLEVRHAYEAAGFTLETDIGELPDHVAVELEFLARLSEEEAVAWTVDDEAKALQWLEHEHAFLERHLGAWLPTLTARVTAATISPFYRSLARTAQAFVTHARGQVTALVRALSAAAMVCAPGHSLPPRHSQG
ncbi:MAG: molecular chaperone TorD family protein [Nitrospinae bacterium]|nr:molecular chaperone TorD family protein [Nitrospinota bacterium]